MGIPDIFVLQISDLSLLWSKYTLYDFNTFKLIKISVMGQNMVDFGEYSLCVWKENTSVFGYSINGN